MLSVPGILVNLTCLQTKTLSHLRQRFATEDMLINLLQQLGSVFHYCIFILHITVLRDGCVETKLALGVILLLERFELLLPPALVTVPALRSLVTVRIIYVSM
jgi:hypothetical protein